MHGGRSTGPRTPEGLERLRAARTIHGHDNAEARARNRYRITLQRRVRIGIAASYYQDHLHPDARARLYDIAPELWPPSPPTGGITAAIDQMRRRAVAAALLPWKRAIADAKKAHLEARLAARAADPNARPRPPRPTAHRPTPEALFAALLAKLHATDRAMPAHDAGVPEPLAPFPGPIEPAATASPNRLPEARASAAPANATKHTRPTPTSPTGQTAHVTGGQNPMHQIAPRLRTMRTGQNPMHQFPAPLHPRPRPTCPTAPPAANGRASSATCTAPYQRPPARDHTPHHGTVKCNCPKRGWPSLDASLAGPSGFRQAVDLAAIAGRVQ